MDETTSIIEAAQNYDIVTIINIGLAYAIIIAGALSVFFIFIGGISFILSGGQEEKIKQAVSTIRYAIIGLIVTLLAVVIIQVIGRIFGLDVIKYIDLGRIVQTVTDIGSDLSGNGADTLD